MADTRLRDTAQQILDTLAAALAAEGIDVPTRQFITSGDIAHDFAGNKCAEALVITWDGNFQGTVGQGTGNLSNAPIICAMPLVGQFTVALLRCVPTLDSMGRAPSAADLQESGEQLLIDSMTLAAVTIDSQLAGDLSDRGCTLAGIGQMLPIGPLGGVGGTTLTLVIGLT